LDRRLVAILIAGDQGRFRPLFAVAAARCGAGSTTETSLSPGKIQTTPRGHNGQRSSRAVLPAWLDYFNPAVKINTQGTNERWWEGGKRVNAGRPPPVRMVGHSDRAPGTRQASTTTT